jgi:outer membrane receptor protein involved in Fe transport
MTSRFWKWAQVLSLAASLGLAFEGRPLLAQSATGSMSGDIVDSGGAPLPGVTVTAKNVNTGAVRNTVSGAAGNFSIQLMPVGIYDVTGTLSGFSDAKAPNVRVDIGSDAPVKLVMKLASVSTEVTVTSEAPIVETTKSEVSSVVNEKFIQTLPTNGRNFIDFVLTTPAVTRDPRLGDISFAGQRGTLNSLVVDGADNNNTFFGQALGRTGSGRAPYQFSEDAVQEFQVNTNAYSAEYGRAGGAVINVVTKSGTNDFHGSAFEFFRDRGLNANDYINVINGRPKGAYHFNQFGATIGGPIVRDRFFFFADYDGQRNTQPNLVVPNFPANLPTDPDTQAGVAKVNALASSWARTQNQDVYLVKLDGQVTDSHHVSARFNHQDFTGQNFENGGITNAQEHTGNSNVKTDTITASIASTFGASFVNELRGQYAKDQEPGEANSDKPEAVIRQNGQTVLTAGRNFFSPRETTITRYQVADTANYLFGQHSIKVGFDALWDKIFNFFPGNFSGSYTFSSLANFNKGIPATYVQAFPGAGTTGPVTNPDIMDLGIFALDEWRLTPHLTLNIGVRWDREGIHQPTTLNPDAQLAAADIQTNRIVEDDNNVAPRLGIAWSPQEQLLVHAGYGMFYGRTPAIMLGTASSNNGINVQTITFTGASVPTYPNTFPSLPTGAAAPKPDIFYFPSDYESPLVQQANLGVEKGFSNDFAIALSYLWVKGDHLQRSIDTNVGDSVDTVYHTDNNGDVHVNKYTTYPFVNFNRVIAFQSSAKSLYNGVTLEVNKRYSNNWQARVAYTLSRVEDTKPDATAVVPGGGDDFKYVNDPKHPEQEYTFGDNDQRHRLVVSGLWNLDYGKHDGGFVDRYVTGGWALSGIVTVGTGFRYSGGVNSDLNADRNRNSDRAPGTSRNQFIGPTFFSVDPRITKHIPIAGVDLQLIAEAFNIFNRSNVTAVNTTYYSLVNGGLVYQTRFGTPTTSAGPRIVQLAAKAVF